MYKYLVVVATPHDVHPVAGDGAGGQGDGHRACAVLNNILFNIEKPEMVYLS
jgi:hypothetical protein